jgi:hypothetical protein
MAVTSRPLFLPAAMLALVAILILFKRKAE